jgi:hypothetical protein
VSDTETETGTDADAESTRNTAVRVRRGLDYALLGGLVLLGAFAALQFYLAADRTINVWVTREYRPPFKMVFNLVILLVVGVGVSRQIRRLTGSGGSETDDAPSDTATDGGVVAGESASGTDTAGLGPTDCGTGADTVDAGGSRADDPGDRSVPGEEGRT